MIKLKETIHNDVNEMNISELILLYEHIKLLKEMRQVLAKKRDAVQIEKILEMTDSSASCWSDTVIEERTDRI